jgi:hypothetical protein
MRERLAASPWAVGLLLGLVHYARRVVDALTFPIERFDEGIQLSSGWFISHGELPLRDFYQPYGPGFGVPGAIARWLLGDGVLADRLVYMLAPAALTTVAYVWMTRRRDWRYGLALAVLTLPSAVPRYALCWLAIFAALLIAERALAGRSFAAALAARPWTFLAAGAVMSSAAWVRAEYGIAVVVWGLLVLFRGGELERGRRLLVALVPVLLAAAPYLWILIAGGSTELGRWAGYALRDFRHYRGQPIDLGLLAHYDLEASRVLFSYVAGAAVALLWAVQLAQRARRRPGPIAPDPTLVAPFLALLAAFATYAQSVRFSAENGVAVLPGIAAAWLALRLRVRVPDRRWVLVGAVLLAVAFLPMLKTYVTLPADAIAIKDQNEAPEPTPRLAHIPVRNAEWPSMAAIHALWHERGLAGRPVLATNRRNDLTYANGAYLPWFLNAPPAAWITTYDPGLADRDSVQRDATAELCRNRAPVVEEDIDPSASSNGAFGPDNYRSRRLDEFIALNYRSSAVVRFYRLRLRDTTRCVQPASVSAGAVRARREFALRADDTPQAAALSVLLVERAQAAGRRAAPDDVAGALLGGFWVPDSQLPGGPQRPGLLALRGRTTVPGEAAAAEAPGSPLTRLATTTAYVTYRPPGAPRAELTAVLRALVGLTHSAGRWPATVRSLFSLQPPDAPVLADVERHGGGGPELERIRFDSLSHGGRPREAIASGLRLARLQVSRPLDQGQTLVNLAGVFDAAGDHGCAARARAIGDGVPGVHAVGAENAAAACAVRVPEPVLKPESP